MDTAGDVGARIAALRKRRGLTQEALAARIGRTMETVSALERGLHAPSFGTLGRLSAALRVPVRDFFAPPGVAAGSPRQAALLGEMLDGARRLPRGDLELAAGIVGLIVGRYGR